MSVWDEASAYDELVNIMIAFDEKDNRYASKLKSWKSKWRGKISDDRLTQIFYRADDYTNPSSEARKERQRKQ